MRSARVRQLMCALLILLVPVAARAQSTIAGLVTDTTGSVLPGVTVEAASPALIEKVRLGSTDSQGRYSIADLRPGVYVVTFTLTGFATVIRDGIIVASNVNVPINAELKVGAVEETVTVSGATPVVDVQSASRQQVLSRDSLDALPTSRNFQQIASLMPGIRYNRPDGGGVTLNQIQVSGHGVLAKETTYMIDGLRANTLGGDGSTQIYHNETMNQEMTFQSSAVGADTQAGGVRLNMIPREGGNTYRGLAYVGGTPGSWVSNNITQELRNIGFTQGDSVKHFYEWSVGVGGPIRQNRLWFFGSSRRQASDQIVADSFFPDGRPGINNQWIQNSSLRLTGQLSPSNKITALYDRMDKNQGYDNSDTPGYEWGTATRGGDWRGKLWYQGQVKWTSTVSSKLMLETGYSVNLVNRSSEYHPGLGKERGTPEWYATAAHNDVLSGKFSNAAADGSRSIESSRNGLTSAVSYVTGSHSAKAGVQYGWGRENTQRDFNADLIQLYRDGVPSQVRVWNTPTFDKERLDGEWGFYGQDAWTVNRLTLNLGVRVDRLNASIDHTEAGAGRFVAFREVARVENLPNWTTVSPRIGGAYDLFGNARTALKASFGRYVESWTIGFARRYNPLTTVNELRNWSDCDFLPRTSTCSGNVLSTNGDNIAQDNEIGPPADALFGTLRNTRRFDPDIRRGFNQEATVGIQHQLSTGLALNGTWYRRGIKNQERLDNALVSLSDYTPVQIVSPLDGQVFTVYNLKPEKLGQVDRIDVTSSDSNLRRTTYNGFEVGLNGRLPRGATASGAWTAERTVYVACDSISDPNALIYCDQSQLDIPFIHEFKVLGTYPLPMGMQVSAVLVSFAGGPVQAAPPVAGGATYTGLAVNWNISRTTRYAADCLGPCTPGALVIPGLTPSSLTVPLIPPGAKMQDRWNQLDLGFKKSTRIGTKELDVQLQIFNTLNASAIINQNQTFGASLGRPTFTLQPRLFRVSGDFKF